MAQLSLFSPVMKSIFGVFVICFVITVIAGIILGIYVFIAKQKQDSDVTSFHIVLHLTEDLQRLNLPFGVLHVRDGKDEVLDSGPLLNEEIPFQPFDRHGTMVATISYQKRLGVQFKCFVAPGPHKFEKIEPLLKAAKFSDISEGGGEKFRIWFILKEYKAYTTIDGLLNNFFYPS